MKVLLNRAPVFGASLLTSVLLIPVSPSFAASFNEKCPDIPACAKAVAEITGQKYVFDAHTKEALKATGNVEFTKDTAELLFTYSLHQEGYSRIKLADGTFGIVRERDARDSAISLVDCDQTSAP